jgi:hypothetical protein
MATILNDTEIKRLPGTVIVDGDAIVKNKDRLFASGGAADG